MKPNIVFYDADCAFCRRWAKRGERWMAGKGYRFEPMPEPLDEMKVVTADGSMTGGAEAVVHLARQVWWAWPVWAVSQVPGMQTVLRAGYRQVARRRQCGKGGRRTR
jgi:predicted DCC family thiol-disulfide oxidoreductase YuxK